MEEVCCKESEKKTIVKTLQNNTQRIYGISGTATRILGLLTGNNRMLTENEKTDCMIAELDLQEKELIEILEILREIEEILN